MNEQTELLREMRDLLRLLAEPQLAKQDSERRATLLDLVGKSNGKKKAVLLMDGSRIQKEIQKESGFDPSDLSKLIRSLRSAGLVDGDEKIRLTLPLPPGFFESEGK